jgi:hypothetical protein
MAQDMDEDFPEGNLGDTHNKSSRKRLINNRENQLVEKTPLLLTSSSHVANVVENIENMAGKGGVVTTPQEKKRQEKMDNDSLEDTLLLIWRAPRLEFARINDSYGLEQSRTIL